MLLCDGEVRMAQPLRRDRLWPVVRELAAFDAAPDQVVSVYLDVCWDSEQQRARTRLAIKEQLRGLRGQAPVGAALERDLARVEDWVEERTHVKGATGERGEARFLCGP